MKFMLTYLTILFISFSAAAAPAKIEGYNCHIADPTRAHEVFSEAYVPFSSCNLTPVSATYDICQVNGYTLIVGIDAYDSLIVTKTGATYEYICEEYEDGTDPVVTTPDPIPVPPEQRQQQQQQQQQQQNQQQQQEHESPGHGGSNIRGRGIIIH